MINVERRLCGDSDFRRVARAADELVDGDGERDSDLALPADRRDLAERFATDPPIVSSARTAKWLMSTKAPAWSQPFELMASACWRLLFPTVLFPTRERP